MNRQLNEDYFNRVEAIEFSVKYDDGRDPRGIEKADIVLVGVSRTSKTPLSHLSGEQERESREHPALSGIEAAERNLHDCAGAIIGLVNSPKKLNEVRKERLKTLGLPPSASYAGMERILEELEYADQIVETDRLRNSRCFEQSDRRNRRPHPTLHGCHEYQPQATIDHPQGGKVYDEAMGLPFFRRQKEQKMLLGGKGANLAEMTNLGLPIPPGFTITTESCIHYFDEGRTLWTAIQQQIDSALIDLENAVGKSFHDPANPLLVSVRSGAAFSMPGMMDTHPEFGAERCISRRSGRTDAEPDFRFRQLPPFHPDVRRCREIRSAHPFRSDSGYSQK